MKAKLRTAILKVVADEYAQDEFSLTEIAQQIWPDSWLDYTEELQTEIRRLCDADLLTATQTAQTSSKMKQIESVRFSARAGNANPSLVRYVFRGRLSLCCLFVKQPIRFRTTTATSLMKMSRTAQLEKLSLLCLENSRSLLQALKFCQREKIGSFRITSTLMPIKTHPLVGYSLSDLPDQALIREGFAKCHEFAQNHEIRTSFHPDQFVVLNSPRPDVVEKSVEDLKYHSELASWIGADVVNIHGGGGFGDKPAALTRLKQQIEQLPDFVRERLTLENDDKTYSPSDLLSVCESTGTPLVYDVHHHRCCPDDLSVFEATKQALKTWNREPLFHISSPQSGWAGPYPERHHDYIQISDFPDCWRKLKLKITVDVEAKAKELAVLQLQKQLS